MEPYEKEQELNNFSNFQKKDNELKELENSIINAEKNTNFSNY